MNANGIGVALVGFGKMGRNHIDAATRVPGAKLVAIVDPHASQQQVSEAADGAVLFADAREMLASVKPDVVHICTPPETHGRLIRTCLEGGANVFVEKPVCESASELDELLAMAKARGLRICAGHQLLRHPVMDRFTERLPAIGRVVHIDSYFAFRKVRKNLTLVGQAIDILPHPTYLLVDALTRAANGEKITLEAMQCTLGGEVRAMLRAGETTATLRVTLAGRPVEHFLVATGTNGTLNADFVRGSLTRTEGAGAGFLPMITIPFSTGSQVWRGALRSVFERVLGKSGPYPGLRELTRSFYDAIRAGGESPTSVLGVRETVDICERIGRELLRIEAEFEQRSEERLQQHASVPTGPAVLVTGGRGFLGKVLVDTLVRSNFRVRVASRSIPQPSERVPGVEYRSVDLAKPIEESLLQGIDEVVHCAAASEPGEAAHQRGTIDATRNLIDAVTRAGIRRMIHISSLAVLKPGRRGGVITENSPIDSGNKGRGPYVWAKAEAEGLVSKAHEEGRLDARIIRPGPIVDYGAWDPPGRLGRDLGSLFVAVGSPRQKLAVVQVQSVAQAVVATIDNYPSSPLVVNLVEPDAPTRGELVARSVAAKPGLRTFWLPSWFVAFASPISTLLQRQVLGMKNPIDLAAAFATEHYDTTVARSVLARSRDTGASRATQ